MAEPESNRELVDRFYEAVGDQDVDSLRDLFVADIEWIHPALGGTFHGADSVIEDVLKPFWADWDLSVDVDRYVVEGDTVVVLAEYHGTYRPTGNRFSEPVAHVWDVTGGNIARFQQFVDTASLQEQLDG